MDNLQLNTVQQQAAETICGSVLVLAGAGSGKTRVLTSRIVNMIKNHSISPYNILAITFTNKAANEMLTRLNEQLESIRGMTICTIHSMCARILRADGHLLGYTDNFSIYGDAETDKILRQLFVQIHIDDDKMIKEAASLISKAKNAAVSPKDFAEVFLGFPHVDIHAKVYALYESALKQNNAMDFDNLLVNAYLLLNDNPEVLESYQDRYRFISVDEFQDTNKVQYGIIKMLALKHGNLFVVGDDDQSIYGWRGADVTNILYFQKDFKDCKVFKLEQNYRSTKKILNAANRIIKNNPHRLEKTLWTANNDGVRVETFPTANETEEAMFVVQNIIQLVRQCGYKYGDCAILMRVNALTRTFEQECLKYNIPYKVYGGFKFFQRKEIKDIVAYLRSINNPLDNEAFLRIINFPKRGIGETTTARLRNLCSDAGISIRDGINNPDLLNEFTRGTREKLTALAAKFIQIETMRESGLLELTKNIIKVFKLDEAVSDEEEKLLNLGQFVVAVAEFSADNPGSTLSDLLQSVLLVSDLDEPEGTDSITLSTIHSAKGLEFRTVFIVGLEEGIFPITRAAFEANEMQEERRLMYVAITRAMERLYLTCSRSRFMYGDRKDMMPSRFYREVAEINNSGAVPSVKQQPTPNIPSDKPTVSASELRQGTIVKHKVFGVGRVIEVKNDNADIAFSSVGIKTLSLKYAPLEIIDK